MGIRQYKPTSPGRRDASVSDFAELTKGAKPEKRLLRKITKTGGRNNQGKITEGCTIVYWTILLDTVMKQVKSE